MKFTRVQLDTNVGNIEAALHFEHDYSRSFFWLEYPHVIRQRIRPARSEHQDLFEEAYWEKLNSFRMAFARECASRIGEIHVLVDVPSDTGFHRPYVSAFKQVYPNCYWRRYVKATTIDPRAPRINELRRTVRFTSESDRRPIQRDEWRLVLIPDDVFATGDTARVVLEEMFPSGLPGDLVVHLACPLRIPPEMMTGANPSEQITEADLPEWDAEINDELLM